MQSIPQRIAEELSVREAQVNAAIGLLDEGATVPFIARYRKEVTGALDDTQMRNLEERLHYLRDMEERRETILASIDEQGKLTPELKKSLLEADTKNRLEDLYLPYKPKRRTKAQIAREAGLEPLADALLDDPTQDPEALAPAYCNKEAGIEDNKAVLDGARQILMERFAEDADLLAKLRQFLTDNALLASRLMEGKENEGAKFRDYFEHTEALAKVPSHRALAMFRGRNESILNLNLVMDADEKPTDAHPCEAMVADHWKIEDHGRPADRWLREAVRWTWRVKLLTHLQTDLLGQLRERAEAEAIEVFAHNLKDLLLAAPAGQKATIGLDPGLRTGVKVAVIDATGKVLDHGAIFPNPPQKKLQEAEATLLHMIRQHNVELIAIGNGTASRETDKFVGDLFKANPDLNVRKVMVNEAGASIYSASEFAAREFPDLDVTIRGAISIARRLQDPLAELVKIEPKSIGVGQYQHDVSQVQLARQLDAVVEDCVNAVGVDVNTASAPLLARVSGLNQSIATNIVSLRDAQGKFANRKALMDVSRFGEKTFEQAAGFLRVSGGDNPLDASAVHPESYGVVEDIAAQKQREVRGIIGDSSFLKDLNPADYTSDQVGLPTVRDIIAELDKPGRDPRPEFKMAEFQDGVEKISDLRPDMILEGTVTNVTNFGAFVDIGVHQDGLVHISALADKFVKDPRDVVKAGDIVRVKVMEVDEARKRIGLSMRMGDKAGEQEQRGGGQRRDKRGGQRNFKQRQEKPAANNAFAAAFANAKQRK
ncbi:RNA-binding transcriptional accessory protein [Halioglobus sp. HI00S01]|nr:Tex family protein [Halioglobus sp. HI00S01]KZX58606.1 RNA-binding transcriptional accessory protein [Halioglobus sp. HI00S01]